MRRRCCIDIKPRTKQRPRVTRAGHAYTPKATKDYEKEISEAWANKWPHPVSGPVGVEVEIGPDYIDIEIYELVEPRRPKGVRGDIDNYQKAILDGLNKVAFDDDIQVHEIYAWFNTENNND